MKKRDVILNTEAHREAFNEFADIFRKIEAREHWTSYDIMSLWLDAASRAIRGRMLTGEAFDKNEAEYMRIVKACQKPQETMRDLAHMLGCAECALTKEPVDFIGPVFSALVASKELGQFFTPYSLSLMMAQMTIPGANELKKLIDDKGYISLQEPSCGVGGMILATNQVLRERGIDVARQAHWQAVDIDYRGFCGVYIQCVLTDCSATVIHGNSLSLEQWDAAITPAAALFPKRQKQETTLKQKPELVTDKRGQFAFDFKEAA